MSARRITTHSKWSGEPNGLVQTEEEEEIGEIRWKRWRRGGKDKGRGKVRVRAKTITCDVWL